MVIKRLRPFTLLGVAFLLLSLSLSGCAATAQPVPTSQPIIQPTTLPTVVSPPATTIPVPPTTLPTEAPVATPTPTAVPPQPTTAPTTRPGLAPLVGPEWRIVGQGDLYRTGVETVVAYLPSSVVATPRLQPPYVGYGVAAEQIVVVQRNAQGQPWVRLLISPGAVQLNGDDRNPIFPPGGPNSRTLAFALAVDNASGPYRLVPLGSDGRPVESGFATSYTRATNGFTFSPLMIGQPQTTVPTVPPPPTVTPQPQPTAATLSGWVGYPSSGTPPLDIFAINVNDPSQFYTMRTPLNASQWSLRVPAGSYHLLAYPAEPGWPTTFAGAYSEYVRCGMGLECTNHSLVPVTVGEGQSIGNLNIGDWYAPEGSFPIRPQGTAQPQP